MFSGSGTSRSSRSCSSITSGIGVSSLVATGCAPGRVCVLRLQVAVDEVDLLQSAQALADLLGPDLPDALDALQLGVRRRKHLVQPAERAHDVRHDDLRQARDPAENA